jgi:hypothetical protein
MDPDNVFNLFDDESNSDIVENAKEIKDKLEEFKDSPIVKIGMFTKLILNHQVFHSKLESFLKKEEPTYDVQSTKESSEFVVYNRAWYYLNQVDINKKKDLFAVLDFNPKMLNKALESALLFFENGEEYLKCAHIFKIQQILKERK